MIGRRSLFRAVGAALIGAPLAALAAPPKKTEHIAVTTDSIDPEQAAEYLRKHESEMRKIIMPLRDIDRTSRLAARHRTP